MLKQALTLFFIGAGFAAGMSAILSCNTERSSATHNAYAQDKGDKHGKGDKEGKEEDEDDDEQPITLAQAPAPVRAAILKLTSERSIQKVTREADEHVVVFEVDYDANGVKSSAALSEQGVVMELEKEVPVSELPQAAMDAISKHHPNASVKSVTAVQKFLYEANVDFDGKTHHVAIDAAGKMPHKK